MEMEKPEDRARLLNPDEFEDPDSHDAHEPTYSSSPSNHPRSFMMTRFSPKTLKYALLGVGIALFLLLAGSMMPSKHQTVINMLGNPTPTTTTNITNFRKPEGIKITGVIFYGRARFVDILDCYLQKNLAVNGGLLDEVLFMENTDNEEDIAYMHELVERVPQYTRVAVKREGDAHGWGGFNIMWSSLTEDDTIYLKIDDDIVWIHEDAVPRMIQSLLNHPEAHDIAGNIINSPLTNFFHYHNDAVYPYLPETKQPIGKFETADWRVDSLPTFDEHVADEYDWGPQETKPAGPYQLGSPGGPPFEGHRWLPLKNDSEHLLKTPIQAASYDPFGMGWKSWAMGAQQHYSLLRNIENGWLSKYWFGNGEGLWNMQYGRYNLNFLAIWGSSVAMKLPGADDEEALTVTIPLEFKRPCLVDTHALIAHFNFGTQPEIGHTDLLERYRAYANEFVCTANNQKKPLA